MVVPEIPPAWALGGGAGTFLRICMVLPFERTQLLDRLLLIRILHRLKARLT